MSGVSAGLRTAADSPVLPWALRDDDATRTAVFRSAVERKARNVLMQPCMPECAPIEAVRVLPGAGDGLRLRVGDAQLHADACIHCGRGDGELLGAGHVRTEVRPGQHLVWAVVACPDHQDGARC